MRYLLLPLIFLAISCDSQVKMTSAPLQVNPDIQTGASQTSQYVPLLKGRRVAVVANNTSFVGNRHLVDTLLALGVEVRKVFAPEHGFRGDAGAGETIRNGTDPATGLPLVSLYGDQKKPTAAMLSDIDVVIFDIQDVGARFFTYISTMHLVMEACAENGKAFMVLDRPNPNGFYVDGPVLNSSFSSFVGKHPVPVVHGCTVGELAKMINGEGWLGGGRICDLTVIPCANYSHRDLYNVPIPPSPNLRSMSAIYLYPSLCFFEGTIVSVGRGTDKAFEVVGYPGNTTGKYTFTPQDKPGRAVDPQYEGRECSGHDLTDFGNFYFTSNRQLYLEWITGLYEASTDKSGFFSSPGFFDKLAGTDLLRKAVIAGKTADQIRSEWQADLIAYKQMRRKYLLYPDFE